MHSLPRSSTPGRTAARPTKTVRGPSCTPASVKLATAEEVVKQLDADAEARRSHLALYLRAKTTLRERQVADARNQRIGAFVRSVVTIVVVGPFRLLRSLLSIGSDVAVEMLPPARRDPAKARVSTLTRDPEFAKAAERFTATSDGATPIAGQHEESRGAKAA
jgi:hypothetical protein